MHAANAIVHRLSEPRPDPLDIPSAELDRLVADEMRPGPYTPLTERQLVTAKRMLAKAYGDEGVEVKLVICCGSVFDDGPCDQVLHTYKACRAADKVAYGPSAAEAASALLRCYPPAAEAAEAAAHGAAELDDAGEKLATTERPDRFETA